VAPVRPRDVFPAVGAARDDAVRHVHD
jgi:hypothetical protein